MTAEPVTPPRPWASIPLLWRAVAANAAILAAAFAGLVIAPVRVPVPVAASELLVLAALLAANLAALIATFNRTLDRLESERRERALEALMDQEAERRRIARALHDEVGQTLTGAMLQIEGLALSIPDALRPQLEELRETARHGTEELGRIARGLRPDALEALGLHSGLAALATAVAEQEAIDVRRHLERAPALHPEQELVIYRVAQEALANVAHHAGASTVDLVLAHDHRRTVLTIDDDGRGLPPGPPPRTGGIRRMRDRALLIGAELDVTARERRGTRVRLVVPHGAPRR